MIRTECRSGYLFVLTSMNKKYGIEIDTMGDTETHEDTTTGQKRISISIINSIYINTIRSALNIEANFL